jgi:hypothetical protein
VDAIGKYALFAAMGLAGCLSLATAGCGDAAPEDVEQTASAPEAPAAKPQPKPPAEPEGPSDEERKKMIAGEWCLRSRRDEATKERTLDGSNWTFSPEGTFRHEAETPVQGEWKLDKNQLELTDVGTYEVVSLDKEGMVLRSAGTDHEYFRECGEELDQAKRIQKLCEAANKGDILLTKALLDTGVDVNAVDPLDASGRTALVAAAQGGHEATVSYLLDRGANATLATAMDKTPFDLAQTKPEVLQRLVAELPKPKSLDAPALLALPKEGDCPADHIALHEVCVHVYALPRPQLRAEIETFVTEGTSPELGSYRPEKEIRPDENKPAEAEPKRDEATASAEDGDPLDPAKLDPAMLVNLEDARSASKSTKRKPRAKPSKELREQWCRASRQAVDNARAGKNRKYADMLGLSDAAYRDKLEEKHARECPGDIGDIKEEP